MTRGQGFDLGPFSFTVLRTLLAVGFCRVIIRKEWQIGKINKLDYLMLVWGLCMLTSSFFHKNPSSALIYRLGIVYNICGIYFLVRFFCRSFEDIVGLCKMTAITLIPVAGEMMYEKLTAHNLFSLFGEVSVTPTIRDGKIRANGPFAHAILAGTVGATCLPFMIGIWKQSRKTAASGIAACLTMTFASASSGPVLSAMAGLGALYLWLFKEKMRQIRWLAIVVYSGLVVFMQDPAYYIIARIDLTGSSTGWHRARLIEMALKHINEWWLAGTDYTRHWMPTGVTWSPDHTDITNYYIKMGVLGGLPVMLLFIAIMIKSFSFVGQTIRQSDDLLPETRFVMWALGSSLFAHAVTGLGVSYFDNSFIFLYLTIAAISSAWSEIMPTPSDEKAAGYFPQSSTKSEE
jgi:hypothetical protein